MSDKISSSGTLRIIPDKIYYAKRQLTTNLKREPTNQELANHLRMSEERLNDILKTETMETEYNENSLSPSVKRSDKYFGSPLQKNTRKVPLFDNPLRYEEGGKKRQRKYKKRTHTKKYKKSKTRCKSNKKSKSMKKYI